MPTRNGPNYLTRAEALQLIQSLVTKAAVGQGDMYSPAFVQIDPVTGEITFDFTGHISAEGLDLKAGESSTPPADRKVRWLRESDGVVVAEVFGYHNASPKQHSIALRSEGKISSPQTDAGVFLNAELPVENLGGNRYGIAGVSANSLASPDGSGDAVASQVLAFVQAWDDVSTRNLTRVIIEDDGDSDYVQTVSTQILRLEVVGVTVNLASIVAHSAIAQSFSHSSVKVGDHIAFLGPSVLSPDAITGRGLIFQVESPASTAGQINTTIYNAHTAAADKANAQFTFLLIHHAL